MGNASNVKQMGTEKCPFGVAVRKSLVSNAVLDSFSGARRAETRSELCWKQVGLKEEESCRISGEFGQGSENYTWESWRLFFFLCIVVVW